MAPPFSKAVEKMVIPCLKTSVLVSKVEKAGELLVAQMKENHRLLSIFRAKPLPQHSEAAKRQPG